MPLSGDLPTFVAGYYDAFHYQKLSENGGAYCNTYHSLGCFVISSDIPIFEIIYLKSF